MKRPAKPPMFLERSGYRQRRLMDALRLLPVLGLFLWLFPLFWPSGAVELTEAQPVSMSTAVTYVFGVWAVLIAMTFALRAALHTTLEQDAAELEDAGSGETRE